MEQILPTGERITLIHFTYDTGGGNWRIACMPNMEELHKTKYHPPYMRANMTGAVTCPACKRAAVYLTTQTAERSINAR